MNFKIVSTSEKNGIYFCVIPHQWEKDGRLYWPDHLTQSQREALRCNPTSAPEDSWSEFPCIVKFTGIENFRDALKIEKQLSDCTDTDAEEALFHSMTNRKRAATKTKSLVASQLTDRNNLFDDLQQQCTSPNLLKDRNVKIVSQQVIKPSTSTTSDIFLKQAPKILLNDNVNNAPAEFVQTLFVQDDGSVEMSYLGESSSREPGIDADIHQIKSDIINIKNDIVNMKDEVKKEYNKINLNLDKIFKLLSDVLPISKASVDEAPKEDLLQMFNFPLVLCEEIHTLDEKIRNNAEFKSQLIAFFSKIGGTSREEDGTKIAYKVIDSMFSPIVLVNYTWTGVSRGKNFGPKKSFQILEGILDVFFQVISLADNRHTKQKNCSIFKDGVLKYATKRTSRKRTSLGSKKVSKTNIDETDEITTNDNLDKDVSRDSVEEPVEADAEDSE